MNGDIRLPRHQQADIQRVKVNSLEDDGIPDEFKHFTSNLGDPLS